MPFTLVAIWLTIHPKKSNRYSIIGWMPPPKIKMIKQTTDSCLQIWIPESGKQCWDSPIPSSNIFNGKLRLRGKGIQSGFTTRQAEGDDKND